MIFSVLYYGLNVTRSVIVVYWVWVLMMWWVILPHWLYVLRLGLRLGGNLLVRCEAWVGNSGGLT